ncbi:MAG: hypothetical protein ABFS23_00045 [Pseudomonadota bacterium]
MANRSGKPHHSRARKGRGATFNPRNRFDTTRSERLDDGWAPDEESPPLRTTLGVDTSRCSDSPKNRQGAERAKKF